MFSLRGISDECYQNNEQNKYKNVKLNGVLFSHKAEQNLTISRKSMKQYLSTKVKMKLDLIKRKKDSKTKVNTFYGTYYIT